MSDTLGVSELPGRIVFFAGKASPESSINKAIIQLVNRVAKIINSDSLTFDNLKVVFLPNFCMNMAEKVIPALDAGEMLSKPGTEAYGATNVKVMMNGGITLSSHDGINELIRDQVGPDNILMFGDTEHDLDRL